MVTLPEKKSKIGIVIEAVWLAIIFLIPLYFDRGLHNIFEIPKNIMFQGLVEILLFVYLIKLVLSGREKGLWTRIKYLAPAIIFIFILGISTIFSQVRWFSFWGSWERRMGYLAWLHFFVFASILILNIKRKDQIYRILLAITLASFFVGVYGIIQALDLEPIEWTFDPFLSGRIFSTIGQPNFLGSWILLVLPIILFGLTRKKFILKVVSGLLAVLLIVALFMTKSRGAWIGFIALTGFLVFFFLWRKNKKMVIIPVLCLLGVVIILIYLNQQGISPNYSFPLLYRLQTLADIRQAGQYRLMHWQASWDLIKQKLILGYGLGSQRFNFPGYYRPEFAVYEKPNIYLDYAHNDILDTLLAVGFIGLASYLFLIGLVFWLGLRYYLKDKEKRASSFQILAFLILGGLTGYLVSILFSFHVMSTLLYFWLFIILIIILSKDLIQEKDSVRVSFQNLKLITPKQSLIIILLLALTIAGLWRFNARGYLASHYGLNAAKAKAMGDWSEALSQHEKAVKISPDDPYFRQEFALTLYQAASFIPTPDPSSPREGPGLEKKLFWLNLGIENIEKIPPRIRPMEALVWIGWLRAEKAYLTLLPADFQEAEKSYQEVARFSPQTALIYNRWCNLKIYRQDWSGAIETCEKAISLYPDISHPHLNEEHRQEVVEEMLSAYINLASIYQRLNKDDIAIGYYKKSVYLIVKTFYPTYPETLNYIYWQMVEAYRNRGDIERAIFWAEHAKALWPKDANWLRLLTLLYQVKEVPISSEAQEAKPR